MEPEMEEAREAGTESVEIDELFADHPLRFHRGERVLVLACGTEPAYFQFPGGIELYWIDALGPFMYLARSQSVEDSRFVSASPVHLPFKPMFDVIVCPPTCTGQFSFSQLRRVLREASRTLKHGGRLIVEYPSIELLSDMQTFRKAHRMGGTILVEERWLERATGRLLVQKLFVEPSGRVHKSDSIVYLHADKLMSWFVETLGFRVHVSEEGNPDAHVPSRILVAEKSAAVLFDLNSHLALNVGADVA